MRLRPNTARATRMALHFWLWLALSQAAVGLFLDYVKPEIRFPEAVEILGRARDLPRAPDILFLGSSRFKGSVKAADLGHLLGRTSGKVDPLVFNGAVSAGDPLAQEWMLNRLLDVGLRPPLVAIEVSPDTLSHRIHWVNAHITRQFDWAQLVRSLPYVFDRNVHSRILSTRFLPLYTYREELAQWITGVAPPYVFAPPAPSQAPPVPPLPILDSAQIEAALSRMFRDFRVDGLPSEALERMLKRCRELGLEVLLVSAPLKTEVRAFYGRYNVGTTYFTYIADLCGRFGCRHVDASNWIPDAQFEDLYHSTWEGGLTFNRRLAEEALAAAWLDVTRGQKTQGVR